LSEGVAKKNWRERKEAYLKHLEIASEEALLVSTADKLHSIVSLMEEYKQEGPAMWSRFNAPKEEQMWFYKRFAEIADKRLEGELGKAFGIEMKNFETSVFKNSELRDSRFPLK
jgi:hypothetical protein